MDYYGLPTQRLENAHLRVDYLQQAGPRIVRLMLPGSDFNLLAEEPQRITKTIYGDYHFLGGHRLWHAPENLPRTYVPDDDGLEVIPLEDGGVRLLQPVEAPTGIQKSMELRLLSDRPAIHIIHRLENAGQWSVELAPWAITQMAQGSVGIIPQHTPAAPRNGLLPDRLVALWPYTMLTDPRLHLEDDFILVDGVSRLPACKIGVMNGLGWMGYLRPGVFFLKRFGMDIDRPHVDFGCNCEIYVDDTMIEIETLGALQTLLPGQSAVHDETWELFSGLDYPLTLDGVRALARDLRLSPP